jgi:hypothetical protein
MGGPTVGLNLPQETDGSRMCPQDQRAGERGVNYLGLLRL